MSKLFLSFFGSFQKTISLEPQEFMSMRETLLRYMHEHPASAMSSEEKGSVFENIFHAEPPPASENESSPLFFGVWSGMRPFRYMKPFCCDLLVQKPQVG
ncbi:MAG: hypothetical protein Q7R81_03140 [Candidatus Peregrinibacteria bacterium]|nr:hypothetical protein [Candidatus Peregrinibacteria bacterium]